MSFVYKTSNDGCLNLPWWPIDIGVMQDGR